MGGHIVRPLGRVAVALLARREPVKRAQQVTKDVWIRILLNDEGGGGVLHEQGDSPLSNKALPKLG